MRVLFKQKKVVFGREKKAIFRLLFWQCIVLLLIALLTHFISTPIATFSALMGGLLILISTALSALYFFTCQSSNPKKMMRAGLVSELIKIISLIILMIALLHWCTVSLAPLLIGLLGTYLVLILIHWM